jgi:DUF438 domain-containing protein
MSEIINNRQQRIEIMKSLIRQLHQGAAEEKVRRQLETVLDEAEYSDVFLMEMQLIQEGIPKEAIQDLCDTHTRVLKKHLDLQETPQTIPGHPVHTFMEENKAVIRSVKLVRLLAEEINALPDRADAFPKLQQIHGHLNELMDVDKHYRRKEHLLFPYFEKKEMPGPPAVMWGKHDEVREFMKQTIFGLTQIKTIAADEAKAFLQLAVLPAMDAIEDMIYKEEKILFPTALDLLTEQEWYEIYIQSDEIGYCIYVPEFVWQPEGGSHQTINKSRAQGDRIHMPTGSFSLEEMIGMFKTLPVDLTFVDKDDVVRYFSPGEKRIFDRTRAILGRKVQYCHPPKSVHIVNKILEDFKTGRQNTAKFWINLGGKFIHIAYFAMHNERGEYIGTLEVTQDLTGLRQLQGERRLLTYDQENK